MTGAGSAIRLVVRRLRSDAANRLAWSMGAAIVARLGLLLLAVAIGRRFGPSDYGAFTFATGVAVFVAQFSVLGFPMLMNRLIPEMLRDRDWDALRGLRDAGDAVVIGVSLVTAALLLGAAALTSQYGVSFVLSALLVVPFASASLRRQQLAALRRPAIGLFFDQGFGALLAGAFLFAFGARSIILAVVIFAGGLIVGNLFTFVQVRRLLPPEVSTAKRKVHLRQWLGMSLPMLAGTSAKLLMNRVDILMLAPLAGLYQSGLYGAAFRITFLLTFPQVVLMSVVTPMISEAFAHGQHARVTRLVRGSLLFAVLTAVPSGLVLVAFPEFVVTRVFGASFAPAALSLALLAIGQTAASLSIPLQSSLIMSGREGHFGILNMAALGLHVVLNYLLIPPYGANGASASTAVVLIAIATGQVVLNWSYASGKAT
jgi:O-antigen/teichoic acid export membrane protein